VYEQVVRPAMVDLPRVAAHHAIASLFEPRDDKARVYAFEVEREAEQRRSAGRARLLLGCARVTSSITLEAAALSYGVLHLGDHLVSCGVKACPGRDAFEALVRAVDAPFERADLTGVLRLLDQEFGHTGYSIASLFRDEQHAIVQRILEPTLENVDAAYRHIYEQHAPLARFLKSLDLPVPRRIHMVGAFVISQNIRRTLESAEPDLARVRELLDEAPREGAAVDGPTVSRALSGAVERALSAIDAAPSDAGPIHRLADLVGLARTSPFDIDLAEAQNALVERLLPMRASNAGANDSQAGPWRDALARLGEALRVRVPA
jgi:hypothetical protein